MTAEDIVKMDVETRNPPDAGLPSYLENVRGRTFPAAGEASVHYSRDGDAGLMHQYAELKKTLANNVWGLQNAGPAPGVLTVVAHRGRQCLAGVQTVLSSPREPHALPCERQGFSLQKTLPELDLYNVIYGEMADFAALPEHQETKEIVELFQQVVLDTVAAGVKYLFVASPLSQAKRFRNAAHIFSLQCDILQDIKLPDYDELAGGQACLAVLDLTMMEGVSAAS